MDIGCNLTSASFAAPDIMCVSSGILYIICFVKVYSAYFGDIMS